MAGHHTYPFAPAIPCDINRLSSFDALSSLLHRAFPCQYVEVYILMVTHGNSIDGWSSHTSLCSSHTLQYYHENCILALLTSSPDRCLSAFIPPRLGEGNLHFLINLSTRVLTPVSHTTHQENIELLFWLSIRWWKGDPLREVVSLESLTFSKAIRHLRDFYGAGGQFSFRLMKRKSF